MKGVLKSLEKKLRPGKEPIVIMVERTVSDVLVGPGEVTSLKRITLWPDGSTTNEILISDETKNIGGEEDDRKKINKG